jgi:hypothetical protein
VSFFPVPQPSRQEREFAAATGITQAPTAAAASPAATFNAVTIKPTDIQYPGLTSGMNQRWVSAPDYIRVVSTTEQVTAAVQEAVEAGKRISIQGGGHCYTDFVHNPEVKVVINMTEMSEVYFDTARNAYAVEAGATLTEVYETLFKVYGVTFALGASLTLRVLSEQGADVAQVNDGGAEPVAAQAILVIHQRPPLIVRPVRTRLSARAPCGRAPGPPVGAPDPNEPSVVGAGH